MTVVPYKNEALGKKEQVAKMFNSISGRYDFLNHFLSLGIDIRWRKKAIRFLREQKPKTILDVATGTGDFAIEALTLNPDKIIGVDISEGMLEVGKRKIRSLGLENKITLQLADSENLPFPDNFFDAVIVAFGVRNFEDLDKGLKEIFRVVKTGGSLVVLEFSKPKAFPLKQFYYFYFKFVLPVVGKLVSRDKAAYTYLPESVQAFPDGEDFLKRLVQAGFSSVSANPLSFGISSLYTAKKMKFHEL
jgi:demethylmenaquinone methyltransferase / 2-methoxy-6-polyprenyl-1,4-benzoquinol methylase